MLSVPQKGDTLELWLEYILAMHPIEIDMGLTRVAQVAQRLGVNQFTETKVITVAGTNGKGTTCAMLASVLGIAGYSVGVYSSPHLLRYNERININGQDVSDQQLLDAFVLIESARAELSLTFFEFATLAALVIFKQQEVEVMVLEVGLGGRLDATNIIDADVSAVTAIDLDHQEYLGDTRELVGREKAGIFRAQRPAVCGDANAPQSISAVARELGAQLRQVGQDFSYQQHGQHFDYQGSQWHWQGLPVPQLPLANAATALAVLESLFPDLSRDAICQGLSQAKLAGRFECVATSPLTYVDVAHNPHAARYLASKLRELPAQRVIALCGMLKDKDIKGVLDCLAPVVDNWYLIDIDNPRGASALDLQRYLTTAQWQTCADVASAWQRIRQQWQVGDVVIVFGSFYTVAAFNSVLEGK
ncbi:bifunctional tetrahydrofolate synthase/dihydrofolate synthase [Shewanella sp. NIFS-20-20]|uniref:bifunctional tetrahydrofolate synthase/dihydrofolate synthase n=1 Tax=Shewanella sp. NIFS-20-20 TaxID=2853806 RepID=UPI001C444C55|nr:bifunctional tetrahydrofolate synthase/dihydrofolate synthase [Shewanella sp. NIFS-20-20]